MPETAVLKRYALVVFDADETLRRTTVPGKPCPHSPGEWALIPGVREILGRVRWGHASAPRLGFASNQDQVGYGHLSLEMARRLLRDLAIAATGTEPAGPALQLCPHPIEAGCECRKPKPRMLLRIMEHYGVGPRETIFVGNDEVDRAAAERAGVDFIWASTLFDGADPPE